VNWQLARYFLGTGLATFADRLAQVQLLSAVVMSGPDGQGLGSNTLSLLMPLVLFSYGFGALADRRDNRKLLFIATAARGLLVLSIPTILSTFGATGMIIPICIFAISTCIVSAGILDITLMPRLMLSPKQLRKANAISLFATTAATLASVSIAPFLSDVWLPHETLRLAAIFYFIAMFLFWTLDRRKTEIAPRKLNDTEELDSLFKVRRSSISLFRLQFLTYVAHCFFYCLLLVFCLQNTQFNNAQASSLFTNIALGFMSGTIASLTFLKRNKPSSLIGYGTSLSALACLLFIIIGNTTGALKIFLLTVGTAGGITIVSSLCLMQKEFNQNVRGKVYGAILCLSTAVYALTAVAVEQITVQYSAFTILKILASAWLIFALIAALSSHGLKNRWHRARHKRKSKLSSKTASV
jgi:predicted MFS family arabinose efflux permease